VYSDVVYFLDPLNFPATRVAQLYEPSLGARERRRDRARIGRICGKNGNDKRPFIDFSACHLALPRTFPVYTRICTPIPRVSLCRSWSVFLQRFFHIWATLNLGGISRKLHLGVDRLREMVHFLRRRWGRFARVSSLASWKLAGSRDGIRNDPNLSTSGRRVPKIATQEFVGNRDLPRKGSQPCERR